jgi:hypothetical protein
MELSGLLMAFRKISVTVFITSMPFSWYGYYTCGIGIRHSKYDAYGSAGKNKGAC